MADGARNPDQAMENSSRFDLNEAIRSWRATLEVSPALRAETVDELESHLRDSAAALEAGGLSAEEAFLIACRRLGTSAALEREFGKVNTGQVWLNRAVWMVAGSVVIGALWSVVSAITNGLTVLGGVWAVPGHVLGAASSLVSPLLLLGILCWLWRAMRREGGRLSRLGTWLQAHPVWTGLVFGLGLLILGVAAGAVQVLAVRTLSASTLGIVAQWRTVLGGLVPILLWPALLAWLLSRAAHRQSA